MAVGVRPGEFALRMTGNERDEVPAVICQFWSITTVDRKPTKRDMAKFAPKLMRMETSFVENL
jgi:hypothetical protein